MALQNQVLEKNIHESEERYRTLTELSPYAILLLESDGKIILTNPMAVKLFKAADEADLIDKSIFNYYVKKEKNRIKEALFSELLKKGSIKHLQSTALCLDGSVFPVEMWASLVRNKKGDPVKDHRSHTRYQ